MQKLAYKFKKLKLNFIINKSITSFADLLYNKSFKTNAKLGFNVDSTIKNSAIIMYAKLNSIATIIFDKFIVLYGVKNFTENLLVFNKNITKLKKNEVNILVLFIYSLILLCLLLILI